MDLSPTPPDRPYRMKILVVSGFLGSGKTTFIRSMVRDRQVRFCVLENEFADSSIDRTVLQQEPGLDVVDLASGCICCTSTDDLVASVMAIFGSIRPDVLVIETTGVGLLSNVLATLRTIEHDALEVLKPVSVVDTNTFHSRLATRDAVFLDQIRSAGTVALSKGETVPVEDLVSILREIRNLNPTIAGSLDHYARQPPNWWDSLLKDRAGRGHIQTVEAPAWESLSLKGVRLHSEVELLHILDKLSHRAFGDIQRAKGILPCGDNWLRFDFVGDRYALSGFTEPAESNAVFIGKFILREELNRQFSRSSPFGLSFRQ